MAAPIIPTPILAGVAALFGFVLYKMLKLGGGSEFVTTAGVQFWDKGQAGALQAALEGAHVMPTLDAATGQPIERVMTVMQGAAMPGTENALAWVRKVQAQHHLVTSSVNLLDKSAQKRLVADILPAEEKTLATGTELAILPPL